MRPDPVLALVVSPSGAEGLAVGGETGDFEGAGAEPRYETAGVMRFPGASPAGSATPVPIVTSSNATSFVVGGSASCLAYCAADANDGIGPDAWLTHALQSAQRVPGLSAFLYTGGRIGSQGGNPENAIEEEEAHESYERELQRFATLLSTAGSMPVLTASSSDLTRGRPGLFESTLAPFGPSGTPYYARTLGGVRVIVLDYSTLELGATQQQWLEAELESAKVAGLPAIVVGNASLGVALSGEALPPEARDAASVLRILIHGPVSCATSCGASAYLFDYPGANVMTTLSAGGHSIPAYGTGTLGYTGTPSVLQSDWLGSSAFLLTEVHTTERNLATNVAPVTVKAIPNIAQLSLDATDGVYLRRSHVALFEGLGRRPAGGVSVTPGGSGTVILGGPEPYDHMPFDCQGSNCVYQVPLETTFTSSRPDLGNFVAHEASSANPRQVELGANNLPVPDPHSGLFCAFNAGTTIVTITAGGLSYSEPVTVQGGSAEYPCGTVPLKNPPPAEAPAETEVAVPEPPGSPQPPPSSPHIQLTVPPAPAPAPAPVHRPHPAPIPATPLAFAPLLQPISGAPPAIVPPPAPPVPRPTPPSGTSQVYQTMGAPEEKREEESATELASSEFSAYDPNVRHGLGPWIVVLVVLAAATGAGIRRDRRLGRRRSPAFARVLSRGR
jgi:hypothetical protein